MGDASLSVVWGNVHWTCAIAARESPCRDEPEERPWCKLSRRDSLRFPPAVNQSLRNRLGRDGMVMSPEYQCRRRR